MLSAWAGKHVPDALILPIWPYCTPCSCLLDAFRRYDTVDPDALADQNDIYDVLRSDHALQEEIQLRLAPLQENSSADIADYVFGQHPEKPKHHVLILSWSLLSAATPITVFGLSLTRENNLHEPIRIRALSLI